ncbi:ornithine cyclodeaminase family protein [Agromyces endophyticus]|uniref:ornithine cyclodeaminase family protein n=1 Tax=Agromyces sp. H17E-10 TaxID=2932244 RepID=UPI001FD48144|nr:ornithine cyclodeaminase family protein [Agromyces sp. H17E-10]UOQ88865.1 ornithine cyclodeaminase family protein [Agromyces sp. H17E-10]
MSDVIAAMRMFDAAALRARIDMPKAIHALQSALRSGFDPDDDPPRSIVDVRHGQLLLMPADLGRYAGQKLATVAPTNPARGLERIQAIYVVLDAETLTPIALLDGTELTSLRTPAMSAAMLDLVAEPDAKSLVVFGTGPQGVRHVEAMRAIRPIERVRFVGRDRAKALQAAARCEASGLDVAVGTADDVADADLVVCATTAREPLFDADLVRDRTALVAVGSHERDVRELPGALLGRSQVIVETDRVARTEAGDVIMAFDEGHLSPGEVVPMARIATGAVEVARDRPRIVKTCGMGWQDLAVAQAAIDDADGGA